MAATVVVPGSVTALADKVSGPVAAAAAVVVGVLLLLMVWLARKVVHKIIGIAGMRGRGGRHACRDANLDPSSDQHCHAQLNMRDCRCGTPTVRGTTDDHE